MRYTGFWLALTTCFLAAPSHANDTSVRVGQTFGDWVFQCDAVGEGKTVCALSQTLVLQQTRQPIVRFNFSRDADALKLSAIVPQSINIPAGVSLQIDGKDNVSLVVETCAQVGCFAERKLDAQLFQLFKTGKALEIRFRLYNAKEDIRLSGSLSGLPEGVAATGWEPKPAPQGARRR